MTRGYISPVLRQEKESHEQRKQRTDGEQPRSR